MERGTKRETYYQYAKAHHHLRCIMPVSVNAWSSCTWIFAAPVHTKGRAVGLYLQLETALVLGLQTSIDHFDSFLPLVCPLSILLVILDVVQLQVSHERNDLIHSALLQ